MIDFSDKHERRNLLNRAHGLCGHCSGKGFYMDGMGNEHDCPDAREHADIEVNLDFALEGAAEYKTLQDANVELFEAQTKFSAAITNLTVQLQRVGEATKDAWTPMSEIRRIVDSPVEGGTLNEIRASVLRETVNDLHYPMEGFEERCIFGEPWNDLDETCAEARRVLRYADYLDRETKEDDA